MRVKMPSLNSPQYEFTQLPNKFRAFVAGFGSGKTWVGCANLCLHFLNNPNVPAGYFAPTYSQIRDIFTPQSKKSQKIGVGMRYASEP